MKNLIFLFFIFSSFVCADEIKTKDLKNETLNSNNSSPAPTQTLTPQQAEDLQIQMKLLKENQEKANKALEELDKEI